MEGFTAGRRHGQAGFGRAMTRRTPYGAFSVLALVVFAIAAAIMATTTGRWEQEALEKQPDFQDQPTLPAN